MRAPIQPGRFSLTGPLLSERLRLRAYGAGDVPFLLDMRSRPDVMRWLYEDVQDEAAIQALVARRMRQTALVAPGDAVQTIVETRDGVPVGEAMLAWDVSPHLQGEIGYIIHPAYQRRGYAVEASAVLLRIGFLVVGLHRIVGRLEARNRASARVLEKLHMRREAELRENEWIKEEWQSEIVYALLDREWAALAQP